MTGEQYRNLTNIVNANLARADAKPVVFERYDSLYFSIYNFPLSQLLLIKDDSEFLHQAYYKMLDRVIEPELFVNYLNLMTKGSVSRVDIINGINSSHERKMKKTQIDFSR